MRSAIFLHTGASLMMLAGCQAEPDFDEQFDLRSRELNRKAQQIEAEAGAQLSAAREAERAEAERSASVKAPAK